MKPSTRQVLTVVEELLKMGAFVLVGVAIATLLFATAPVPPDSSEWVVPDSSFIWVTLTAGGHHHTFQCVGTGAPTK